MTSYTVGPITQQVDGEQVTRKPSLYERNIAIEERKAKALERIVRDIDLVFWGFIIFVFARAAGCGA